MIRFQKPPKKPSAYFLSTPQTIKGDSISKKLDLTVYPSSEEKRDCKEIIMLLQMTQCGSSKNSTG